MIIFEVMGERGVRRGAIPPAYWVIFSGNEVQREENPLISYGLFLPSENVRLGCSASLFCVPIRAEVFLSVCIASSQCSVEHFDGLPQVCNSPSNTSTACRRFATARRTLRRLVASLVSIPQLLIVRVFVALSADPAREISVQSLYYG